MYKIYNNEIKILQFLNGGAYFTSSHPVEAEVYDASRMRRNNTDFGFGLELMEEKVNYENVRPLFAQEIIYDKLDQKMFMAIILTLNMFKKYADFLKPNTSLGAPNYPPGSTNLITPEQAKEVRKNLYILAISTLKALGLYDHNNNEFVDYDEWYKNTVGAGSSGAAAGGIAAGFTDGASSADLGKILETLVFVKTAADFGNITITGVAGGAPTTLAVTTGNLNAILTDIYSKNKILDPFAFLTMNNVVIKGGYSLFNFYNLIKSLFKDVGLTSSQCKTIYYKQIFISNQPNSPSLNPRYHFGGSYDQLEYMLNGGSISSIVRIPNLTTYFKTQLKIIEHKLKVNNKTLSEKSKGDINQIIDALDKHETKLKEDFDLLKNAHLIDSEVIRLTEDKSKLESAKKHLNKHVRYSGALGDIIRTIVKEFKNETMKPAFERL